MQSHRSNRRRHAGLMFIVSLVLAAAAMRPTCAVADGALAVALPDDVVKKGFAYGYVTDYPDADKADAEALKKCRDTTIAGVRPLCEVIQDFKTSASPSPWTRRPERPASAGPWRRTCTRRRLRPCRSAKAPRVRAAAPHVRSIIRRVMEARNNVARVPVE